MARVTTKAAEVKYVLELSKREAEALTEMFVLLDEDQGEGQVLGGIYASLVEAGCESFETESKVEDNLLVITREDA